MDSILVYPIGISESCRYAAGDLQKRGIPLTDHPSPEITHLLLDVPSVPEERRLRELLRMLPMSMTVIGGRLNPDCLTDYRKMDLLTDPLYLAKNAAITAECALRVAAPYLKRTFTDSPALILGWGRIGKCLAKLLSSLGCPVTVAARKESDRALLTVMGYRAVDFSDVPRALGQCEILFNTVPDLPLHSSIVDSRNHVISIDLASAPGIPGDSVIPARGLPGKYAPESSGRLIAETILRLYKEETS